MLESLHSDRPIAVSPALAATIGLEEAVMVHVLAEILFFRATEELASHPGLDFVLLSESDTGRFFPFWKPADLDRIRLRLMQLEMLAWEPHASEAGAAWYALQRMDSAPRRRSKVRRRPRATGPIPPDWRPDAEWVKQCRQLSIPEDFIHAQVARFVLYWRDRGEARYSWGNEFVKHVLKQWRQEQASAAARERFGSMGPDWRPDWVTVDILVRDGINENFIEDAVPEFKLYWIERGISHMSWNSAFVTHVQKQWRKLQAAGYFGSDPKPIATNWRPDANCLEILQLAQIDEEWALRQVREFVLYWHETGEARASWSTIFLQRMKQLWSRRLIGKTAGIVDLVGKISENENDRDDREWVEFHTDHWWASQSRADKP